MSDTPQKLKLLGDDVQASWHRFLDTFEPLRPELYCYCRHLTHSPWDAEDLAQDTMARAFVTLGTLFSEVPEPRAWLFRVASNLWLDRVRRAGYEQRLPPVAEGASEDAVEPQAGREAAGTLISQLSARERVAVLLKDVFDFSLEEIAGVLATTTGAVKAALHRGRAQLREPAPTAPRQPAPGVLDAFAAAFNARDLEALTALLLDTSSVEIVGLVTEYGADAPKDPQTGSFAGTMAPITLDDRGGVAPELLGGYVHGTLPRCEVRSYRGGALLVFWFEHDEGSMVRTLMTVETDVDRISHVRNYFFTPEVIAEICAELGLPYRVNGYRYWNKGAS